MNFGEFIVSTNSIRDVIVSNAPMLPFVIFVLLVISSFVEGSAKGLISQVVSIFSLVISAALSKMYGAAVSKVLKNYFVNILLQSMDIVKKSLTNILSKNLNLPVANNLIEDGMNTATDALANSVSNMLGYVIVFVVSMIIIGIVANMFVGLNAIPIIGSLNKLLGGALGIIKALILVEIVFFIMEQASFIPTVNVAISYIRANAILNKLWTNNFVYMFVLPK